MPATDPFLAVMGSRRGASPIIPLLAGGISGRNEFKHLINLIENDDFYHPLETLSSCRDLLIWPTDNEHNKSDRLRLLLQGKGTISERLLSALARQITKNIYSTSGHTIISALELAHCPLPQQDYLPSHCQDVATQRLLDECLYGHLSVEGYDSESLYSVGLSSRGVSAWLCADWATLFPLQAFHSLPQTSQQDTRFVVARECDLTEINFSILSFLPRLNILAWRRAYTKMFTSPSDTDLTLSLATLPQRHYQNMSAALAEELILLLCP